MVMLECLQLLMLTANKVEYGFVYSGAATGKKTLEFSLKSKRGSLHIQNAATGNRTPPLGLRIQCPNR
jgi:hypothetical protein